jgi:2-keto-3-deoxy-L-rhamnonate aldolase RhmA
MRVNDGIFKERLKRGDILIGGQILESRSSSVMEVYDAVGFDFVLIDREHTALNDETISDHVRVARCLGMPTMVRVAEDCYHELNRTLDQAPEGIFVPRIRSRKQVEDVLQVIKYKPDGIRGVCGSSAPISKYVGWRSLKEQLDTVNKNVVVGIQIETAEALDDLENIISTPGIDIALVGNDDLSVSIGIPGQIRTPDYVKKIEKVIDTCNKYGVVPGTAVGDPESALFWIEKGMKFVWYSTDIYLLYRAAKSELTEIKNGLSETAMRSEQKVAMLDD